MGHVFINYRRGETAGEARALFNELSNTLGKDAVFMDVDNIALGRDFRQVLQERLASCDLMLALIGRDWVHGKNISGQRRLDDASDFVCLEIEAALKRNISITPVLVQGAQMPTLDQLPAKIKDFAYRNGFELSHNRWESDVREMFKRLGLRRERDAKASREAETRTQNAHTEIAAEDTGIVQVKEIASRPVARNRSFAVLGVVGMALVVAAGGYLYYRMDAADKESAIEQQRQIDKAKADTERELAAARAETEKARADAESARKAREQLEADNAQAAAQAKREQAAQAEKARAAAVQEARNREEAAQAERDRVAAEAAAAERERAARSAAKDNVPPRPPGGPISPSSVPKFSGSMMRSMGDYMNALGLKQSDLTARMASPACGRWSEELRLGTDEGRSFRAVCMSLPEYANANGWRLGTVPSRQESMKYCSTRAGSLSGDIRKILIETCLTYR